MPQLWLVDRVFDDKGMVQLTYATTDGERTFRREFAETRLYRQGTDVTAAVEAEASDLQATAPDDVEAYAAEASRMAAEHDPDDPV